MASHGVILGLEIFCEKRALRFLSPGTQDQKLIPKEYKELFMPFRHELFILGPRTKELYLLTSLQTVPKPRMTPGINFLIARKKLLSMG